VSAPLAWPMMELIGRHTTLAGHPLLHLSGEVDLATLPLLHDHLHRLVNRHPAQVVYIDLDGLVALDDTGMGMLLGAAGLARSLGGEMVLVCSDERLLARFALCGLDRAVAVVPRVGEPHD